MSQPSASPLVRDAAAALCTALSQQMQPPIAALWHHRIPDLAPLLGTNLPSCGAHSSSTQRIALLLYQKALPPLLPPSHHRSHSLAGIAVALEALREPRRAAHFYQLCDQSPSPLPSTPSVPPCSAHPACAAARQYMLARDYAEASSCLDTYIQSCTAAGAKPAALALLLSGMRRVRLPTHFLFL
jgi:hypothetical protein